MRLYNATVRLLGGDNLILTEVNKYEVTAAEITLLQSIHGHANVVRISPVRQDKREHRAEKERLRMAYGEDRVNALFPGPRLPVEVDLGEPVEDEDLPDESGPEAAAAEPAKATLTLPKKAA